MSEQPTLRDWFAIHAPAEPWPDFEPVMPPAPDRPPADPVGNDGEWPTEQQAEVLKSWRGDSHWDVEYELPQFSNWVRAWLDYWDRQYEYDQRRTVERRRQWPYYYADQMLRMRSRIAPARETP